MAPKRSRSSSASSDEKKKRKFLTVSEKVRLLDLLKSGKKYSEVAKQYGLNESTVRYIRKDEENIRKTAALSFNKDTKRLLKGQNKTVIRMENALSVWIQDCRTKKINIDTNVIRAKAKALYDTMVPEGGAEGGDDDPQDDDDNAEEVDDPQPSSSGQSTSTPSPRGFVASKGWFERFKRRFGLQSVSLYGEAASADEPAAKRYVEDVFPKIIEDNGYLPEQVFNMDETGLFWKRMPTRTFLFKDEQKRPGFKAHKDRVTLLMCGNAAGFMLKPGLIYKSKNPHALRHKNKDLLPVYWMHNKKAWVTKALTLEWFMKCFIPQVKLYLAEKGLPFKVVLFMDCAGGHATNLQYDGVQVEFLPPNTTSLIQPMDQGVIRAFKALYMRSTMEALISSISEHDETFTMKKYWKDYNIATCLANIQNALKSMKEQTIISSWKKLWPNKIDIDYEGFTPEEVHHSAVDKAVKLARLVSTEGFKDMTAEDVNALIDAHENPLTDEDLEELTRSASEEEVEVASDEDDEDEERGLTLQNMQQMFNIAKDLKKSAQEFDENMVRAVEFANRVDELMSTYKGIFHPLHRLLHPIRRPLELHLRRHPRSNKALRRPVQSFIINHLIGLHRCLHLHLHIKIKPT